MNQITIDNIDYFLADDLVEEFPNHFIGARTTRQYLARKHVAADQYIFARKVLGEWCQSSGKSNRVDKVFLRRDYVEANIGQLGDCKAGALSAEDMPEKPSRDNEPNSQNGANDGRRCGSEKGQYILSGPEHTAPIILAEEEMFRDDEGNVYEVDVRGQRHHKKCYFRVKDISRLFNIPSLNRVINNKDSSYQKRKDYVLLRLSCLESKNMDSGQIKNKQRRNILFLTYSGLMRAIFASKAGNAHRFIDWASKIVFTAHLGTKPQKRKLASSLIKMDYKSFKAATNVMSRSLPGIYLIHIGRVSDYRHKYGIAEEYSGDYNLYKFGYSEDIPRRMREHTKTYGQNIVVSYLAEVDPLYLSRAENNIKSYLADLGALLAIEGHNELCALSPQNEKRVKERFDEVKTLYSGHYSEMIARHEKELAEAKSGLHGHYEAKLDAERAIIREKDGIIREKDARIAELMDRLLNINK